MRRDREAPIEEPEPEPEPMKDPEYPHDPGPAEDPERQPVRESQRFAISLPCCHTNALPYRQ